MLTTGAAEFRLVDRGQIAGGIALELLDEHALARDLAQGLPVGRARDAEPDRQRGAMAGQADHPDVMAEILAAELRPDAEVLCELVNFGFELEIAERPSVRRAARRQRVEIAGGGEFHRLQGLLGAQAPDDDGEVIGRAGGGAEGQDLLLQEGDHPLVGQDRGRRLVEEGLVGRAAALGDEQEFVGVVALGGDVDLRRQVVAGVLLLERRERRDLAVAQVLLQIGVADALGDRRLVVPLGPHAPALLGDHDGGAGVLAHRQHAAGGDIGVLQAGHRRRTCRWRSPRDRRGFWRAGRDGRGAADD